MKKKVRPQYLQDAQAEKLAQQDHRVAKRLLAEGFLARTLAPKRKNAPAKDFYASKEWASVRYAALLKADGRCACCGASRNDGAVMHVDHVKPRSKFPELALSLDNMQVLCNLCNTAKSNVDMSRWVIRSTRGTSYEVLEEEDRRVFRMLREMSQK
jgi:hypothetical protein